MQEATTWKQKIAIKGCHDLSNAGQVMAENREASHRRLGGLLRKVSPQLYKGVERLNNVFRPIKSSGRIKCTISDPADLGCE